MQSTFIGDISAEVEVPTDGTLSRVLHSDEHLRLVAFAFDTGQELTEHASARPIVVQVVSGSITFGVDDDVHTMGPSSWITLGPNVSHSLVALEPSVVLLTLLAATT